MGSNVSYNLKKLVDAGYIHHQRSTSDRRSVRVRLTDKGKAVCDVINELYNRQMTSLEQVGGVNDSDLDQMNTALFSLEKFWANQIRYRL